MTTPARTYVTAASDVATQFADRWGADDGEYTTSPFLPLKRLNPKTKGAHMENIAAEHFEGLGFDVQRPKSPDCDLVVDGHKIEIKGSFLVVHTGDFKWQQIRAGQHYDYLVCMAFYPDRVEYYACTRATAAANLEVQDDAGNWLHNQHGGHKANSGTFIIRGPVDRFPWLRPACEVIPAPIGQRVCSAKI